MIRQIAIQFGNTLKTYNLWYLSIGMQIIETVVMLRHRCQQLFMGETTSTVQILLLMGYCKSISQHLIHSSMLIAQHTLHLFIT